MKPVDCKEIYWDGKHYDLINRDIVYDINFYIKQTKKYGGPALELACGTGRLTIPIAEQGIQITGLDISSSMLSYAREKAKKKDVQIEWVMSDCRNFNLNKKFEMIFYPFNSIAHIHDLESITSCLSCVKKHLNDGGRFIIDFFNPGLDILRRDPTKRYPVVTYQDPEGSGIVVVTENNIYDSASQINRIKWYFKFIGTGKEIVKELNMRMFFPQELDALLHYNGFKIDAKFGDFDESPFESKSTKQIVICSQRHA